MSNASAAFLLSKIQKCFQIDFKCMLSGYDMSPFIRRYAKYLSEKSTAYRLGLDDDDH